MIPIMPLFTYKAVREDGTSVADEVMAADAAELRLTLEAKGYLVLNLQKKTAGIRGGKGSAKDFLIFNQEFTTLVKAGLPILQSLEILHKRTEKQGFRAALAGIIQEIKGGATLSDAMSMYPSFFPPLYTATVRAGEKSGALVDVLKRFIEYQKRMLAVRRKLITALAYPSFLVMALIAVLILFFLYIIPNFTQMYGDQAGSLPFLTTLLIAFTNTITSYAPLIFGALLAAGIGTYLWQKTDTGREVLDRVKLKIPLVRTFLIQYILSQLTRTLATVLRGGIPLVQALDTTAGVIANRVIARKLTDARQHVTEGVSLAESFERTGIAPDMTVRMIEVGESSGDLPQMLEDVSDFYEQEVENRLTLLTTLIEPVLMLSMGIMIAFIVVALYLPIFEMGAKLK
jgi:type IV pilus assembly protein PilC